MRILFTGVGRRIELLQAFRTAALVLNKNILIYGADLTGSAPALAYCNFSRRVVAMRDPGYIDNLLAICKADRIDLLIPTIDTDLMVLAENKDCFKEIGTKVMISEPDMIRICRDKNYTSKFFADCGLCAPMPVNDWRCYNGGFPAFIKPKDGSSSINAFRVDNADELATRADQIGDYIVQPFIDGTEYTIDIFCDWEGVPISIVPRERVQVRAGEVLKTRICMDASMVSEAEKLCEVFKPCGPMTVQLIRDHEGNDWFIEINPRYGGGAPLSMKAGARSAEYVLKLLDGEKVSRCEEIEDGAIYSRFDQSVCVSEGHSRIKGVIFDLDDTLYPEKEYVKSGFKAVSDYLGGEFTDCLWTYFSDGKPAIDILLRELGRDDEKAKVLGTYRSHIPDISLFEGAKELLVDLRENGIKVGIITDGRPEGQKNKLKVLGLNELVDDVIITDELGGEQFRKPCDIAFRIIQRRWRMNPSEIVYIGDNPSKDFQPAQQLGMKTMQYSSRNGLYFSNSNTDGYSSFREIGNRLLENNCTKGM